MELPVGFYDVASGKLGTVVTSLEMFAAPPARPQRCATGWELARADAPGTTWYRDLFRRVGERYLWASRLAMTPGALADILSDPLVEIYSLRSAGQDDGLLELDFRVANECELSFFGVTPELVGCGAGRWLMNRALEVAWARPIGRFWVHTCSLDHPAALPFYERSGFRPFKRELEVFDDPRATGLVPVSAAPDVPLL